jgi:hypothetical protein
MHRHHPAPRGWYELSCQQQEAVPMDDITSNRHAGVIIVSLAILMLGLVSTIMGSIEATRLSAPAATEAVEWRFSRGIATSFYCRAPAHLQNGWPVCFAQKEDVHAVESLEVLL